MSENVQIFSFGGPGVNAFALCYQVWTLSSGVRSMKRCLMTPDRQRHELIGELHLHGSRKQPTMSEKMGNTDFYKVISAMGKHAMWAKKANGEAMHLAPLGFRNVRQGGKSFIEPDPVVYPLVLEASRFRDAGWSLCQICRRMKALGLRSKRGNTPTPGTMSRSIDSFQSTLAKMVASSA